MEDLPDGKRFLTPIEAAEMSRRSPRTLARMRAEGRGPSIISMAGKFSIGWMPFLHGCPKELFRQWSPSDDSAQASIAASGIERGANEHWHR